MSRKKCDDKEEENIEKEDKWRVAEVKGRGRGRRKKRRRRRWNDTSLLGED